MCVCVYCLKALLLKQPHNVACYCESTSTVTGAVHGAESEVVRHMQQDRKNVLFSVSEIKF